MTNKFIRKLHDLENLVYSHHLLSSKGLSLPHFIGIGAQKSGTTWLSENLRCHSGIFLPEEKEVEFFSNHIHKGLHWYGEKFNYAGNRIKGEVSPDYCTLKIARIQFIHDVCPELKIIYLLRNPIERTWSSAVMKLVQEMNRKMEEVDDQEFIEYCVSPGAIQQGFYSHNIERWLTVFSQNQLFLGLYDDIQSSPVNLLKNIFNFLDVSIPDSWQCYSAHKIIIPPVGADYKYADKKRGVVAKDNYQNSRKLMRPRIKNVLKEIYAGEIDRLKKNYELPVDHWLSI